MTIRRVLVAAALLVPAVAAAQGRSEKFNPVHAGDCAVIVELTGHRPNDVVQVLMANGKLDPQVVKDPKKPTLTFNTVLPLQQGVELALIINGTEDPSARTSVLPTDRTVARVGNCDAVPSEQHTEESLSASAYLGDAIDTFAPPTVGGYPPDTATSSKNQKLFGVDFDYRMAGHDDGKVQIWLSGETLHAVRSADIDCTGAHKPPVCDNSALNPTASAKFILKHQTSLEAFASPRVEFAALQRHATTPTRPYVTTRFGFIMLANSPHAYRVFHVGAGLKADEGPFAGSLIEFGWGNNELYSGRSWKRLKVDGLLTFDLENLIKTDKARFFIEMYIDNDLRGPTADSVQTFIGLDFDIRKFFGGWYR